MREPHSPRLVAAKPAAKQLGIPYTSLRDLAFAGVIDPVKVGRAWYFETQDLDQLVDKLKAHVADAENVSAA